MVKKVLRMPALTEALGRRRSSIYNDQESGLLPPLIQLGPRCVGLPEDEVAAIQSARIAGKSPDAIRALVRELVQRRGAA